MTRIFISYRRSDDAGSVGRVRDRLRDAYGHDAIFRDIDSIPKGSMFGDVIDVELAKCEVLLVVIGPRWLDAPDGKGGRRLDDPDDWVRTEVERGLARTEIRVVPVLVGGAALPAADQLPETMRSLLGRNASFLKEDSFDYDFDVLVRDLGGPHGLARFLPRILAAAVVVLLAGGLLARQVTGGGSDEVAGTRSEPLASITTTTVPLEDMPVGSFNVAVAEFTAADPANGAAARELAAALSETLAGALPADEPAPKVTVVGPDIVGPLAGATPDERSRSASRLASEINATVVIGGEVDFSDPNSVIRPDATLNPSALASNPDLAGSWQLGDLQYPGTLSDADTVDKLLASLRDATGGVQDLLRGIAYYQRVDGVPVSAVPDAPIEPGSANANRDAARAAFERAAGATTLPDEGRAAAHAFLGSLALLRVDLPAARAEFDEAAALDPSSTRARLGQAEVLYQESNGDGCEAGTVDGAGLTEAAAAFSAIRPRDVDPPGTAIKGRLGTARALRCRSQAGLSDDFAAVRESLTRVIDDGEGQPALKELVAAAHAERALVVAPAAGAVTDRPALEAALADTQVAIDTTGRDQNEAVYEWQQAFYLQVLGRPDEAAEALARAAALDASFVIVTLDDLVPQPGRRLVPTGEGVSFSLPGYALAFTGADTRPLAGVGALLIALGALAVAESNRRRAVAPPDA